MNKIDKHKLADKFIKEMKEAGLTYDQMLEVLNFVRKKLEYLNKEQL